MNWKADLKLSDLEADSRIEVTCRKSGITHYEAPAQLLARPGILKA